DLASVASRPPGLRRLLRPAQALPRWRIAEPGAGNLAELPKHAPPYETTVAVHKLETRRDRNHPGHPSAMTGPSSRLVGFRPAGNVGATSPTKASVKDGPR